MRRLQNQSPGAAARSALECGSLLPLSERSRQALSKSGGKPPHSKAALRAATATSRELGGVVRHRCFDDLHGVIGAVDFGDAGVRFRSRQEFVRREVVLEAFDEDGRNISNQWPFRRRLHKIHAFSFFMSCRRIATRRSCRCR